MVKSFAPRERSTTNQQKILDLGYLQIHLYCKFSRLFIKNVQKMYNNARSRSNQNSGVYGLYTQFDVLAHEFPSFVKSAFLFLI